MVVEFKRESRLHLVHRVIFMALAPLERVGIQQVDFGWRAMHYPQEEEE